MSTALVENPGPPRRVLSVSAVIVPDPEAESRGLFRQKFTVEVLEGGPFTEEDYRRLSARMVAEAVAAGVDVIGWGAIEEEGGP